MVIISRKFFKAVGTGTSYLFFPIESDRKRQVVVQRRGKLNIKSKELHTI